MADGTLKTFRALSGSQYVFFTSEDEEPAGITNKVVMYETLTDASIIRAAGAQSTSSDILWSWNGEDTSQFDPGPAKLRNFSSATLNVETSPSAALGKYLILSGVGSSGTAVWLVSMSLPSTRYIIEMGIDEVGRFDGAAGGHYCGAALLSSGSGADHHGIGVLRTNGGTGWQYRFDGAGSSIPGNTPSLGAAAPSKLVVECVAGKKTGSIPTFSIKAFSNGNGSSDVFTWDFNTNWSSTWGSSWLPIEEKDLTRFGIAVQSAGGRVNPFIRIQYMIVRRHPLDRSGSL